MKKWFKTWLSAFLAVLLPLSAGGLVSTADGDPPSPDGIEFSSFEVPQGNGITHHLFTLEFDPLHSDIQPLAYSARNGFGATVYDSAVKAEERGYDVKAAVNACFFGMSDPHTSSNPYGGVNISDGRIMQGDNNFSRQWELVFFSDGRTTLLQSKIEYTLSAGDGSWNAPLAHVNICPTTPNDTDTGVYYFDSFCGEYSDAKSPGVEVLLEKTDRTELTVGGTLRGKVVEVRSVTSAGGKIGENQFVLYASNSCPQYSVFKALSAGDILTVQTVETVESSVDAMETCSSAVVTYGYTIVDNWQNVTNYDGLGWDFNNKRAQRTCIGIKPDGSLLIVVSEGRKPETYPGMTVYELADYMIEQGCETAIDLDGGGSTQLTLENQAGELECVFDTESRPVANSLLLVARPEPSADDRAELSALLAQATAYQADPNFEGDRDLIDSVIEDAKSVQNARTSMPGDYRRAIRRLRELTDATNILQKSLNDVRSLNVRQYSEYVLQVIRAAYHKALRLQNNANATSFDRFLAASSLRYALDQTDSFATQTQTYRPAQTAILPYGFNRKINTDDAVLYTPGTSIRGKNLSFTRMLFFRKGNDGSYRLADSVLGGQWGGDNATVEILGFDVVPENGLLLAVEEESGYNYFLTELAGLGQTLFLCGVDVKSQTLDVCAYCIVADSAENLIPDKTETPTIPGMPAIPDVPDDTGGSGGTGGTGGTGGSGGTGGTGGTGTNPTTRAKGDVSGDGKRNVTDYMMLKRHCLKTFRLTGEALIAADINEDGRINATDYMMLKRHCLGTFRISG